MSCTVHEYSTVHDCDFKVLFLTFTALAVDLAVVTDRDVWCMWDELESPGVAMLSRGVFSHPEGKHKVDSLHLNTAAPQWLENNLPISSKQNFIAVDWNSIGMRVRQLFEINTFEWIYWVPADFFKYFSKKITSISNEYFAPPTSYTSSLALYLLVWSAVGCCTIWYSVARQSCSQACCSGGCFQGTPVKSPTVPALLPPHLQKYIIINLWINRELCKVLLTWNMSNIDICSILLNFHFAQPNCRGSNQN